MLLPAEDRVDALACTHPWLRRYPVQEPFTPVEPKKFRARRTVVCALNQAAADTAPPTINCPSAVCGDALLPTLQLGLLDPAPGEYRPARGQ
jgi:hypothetical protein